MKLSHLLFMSTLVAGMALQAANPLIGHYNTYRQTPPFEEVKPAHFMPAFEAAFKQHNQEIARITSNKAAPTFENTIEAYEASGKMIEQVYGVFGTLTNNEMTDELMAIEEQLTPKISEHFNNISLNEQLFQRIKAVYEQRESLSLTSEQMRLLEEMYQDFLNSGATLEGEARVRYKDLKSRLSQLTMSFGQNSLKATHAFSKLITDKELLKGMPEDVLSIAASKAQAKGQEGWLFDLTAPSYIAVLKYADNRDLREEFYQAYMHRAVGGEFDNLQNIKDIVNTRMELGQLFGYPDYASYALSRKMAKNSQQVYAMLDQMREAYLPVAKEEHAAIQGFMIAYEKQYIKLEPWDWSYYSEKMKDLRFDLNDELLRPYFELENVKKGVFGLATKLYGITFKKNTKIQVWHQDVDAYEVFDKDGQFLAVLYTDFFPRPGKRAGAWMSDIKPQSRKKNRDERPFITLTMNFTPPTNGKPSLLSFDELTTFLHEFGHGLHGLLSQVQYAALSGTNVARDFVELPSQIMENWASEKEFLDGFAKHYLTGESIPMELVQKVKDAGNFNVARDCCRQLSFGYLDMAWHTIKTPFEGDVRSFEREAWESVNLLPQPEDCCMSTCFTHLFSGGYAAGYYGYKWSEVLAADAYAFYTERCVFDTERAASFLENILSKGNTEDPMQLYIRFRGQEASIDALLKQNGIRK